MVAEREIIQGKNFEDSNIGVMLVDREDVVIRDCTFTNVAVPIRLKNCRNIIVQSCKIKDIGSQGIDIREGCRGIRILNNDLNGFRNDVQGGHFISTEKTDEPQQHQITIAGNRLTANGKSWIRGKKNGASGDMLSLRSVAGFILRNNVLIGGGEFGMTCLFGSRNGIISENTIRNIDGTGLLIGYDVRNINVHGNNIIDSGCSFENDESENDIKYQSGIHCRNKAENILIVGNLICREKAEEMRYGIQMRETTGMIQANLITGVQKKFHIPKTLQHTVDVDFGDSQGDEKPKPRRKRTSRK